jgi:hypothetical protein
VAATFQLVDCIDGPADAFPGGWARPDERSQSPGRGRRHKLVLTVAALVAAGSWLQMGNREITSVSLKGPKRGRDFGVATQESVVNNRGLDFRPATLSAVPLAMLHVDRWHSPFYWAAFVLQGEWK